MPKRAGAPAIAKPPKTPADTKKIFAALSTQLGTGCDTNGDACNPSRNRRNLAISIGVAGALAGGIVGTIVGSAPSGF